MVYPFYPANNPQYGAYFPANYQPAAPQPQQPQQNTPATISNVWIYDESEVASYPVAPNNAVRLWIASKPVYYEKSADITGKPTVKIFDYKERTAEAEREDLPAYATKEALGTVIDAVKNLAGEVEQMKGDLYGVAGRKKKKEATDDDA